MSCAARPRSAARCRVLGRANSLDYWLSLRPCIALADRTRSTNRIVREPLSYSAAAMLAIFAVIHVLLSASLVGLILMHSGRDAGMGGMGFTPTSQGGTHIFERNLTRVTRVIALLFFLNTILLFRLLK
jgi:preprotein translocase subunit SecG